MNITKAFKKEIKRSTSSTYLKVALFAITLIPLLYGALYLKAFWDPYAKMDKIPVAVVNLDTDYNNNGTKINVGNDLVNKLKKNDSLDWSFVNEKQANDGLNSKKYYASITIPKYFSSTIYSVDGSNPQKATIIYKSRESTNYLATSITNRVSTEIANNLSSEVISKYFNNIFVSIKDNAAEIQKAADGSNQLKNGLATAVDGSGQLKLGLKETISGNNKILNGLKDLNSNQNKLTDGLDKAATAANSLEDGAKSINYAQNQIKSGVDKISSNLSTVESATLSSQAAVSQAQSIIDSYIANHPESASELTSASQILAAANSGLAQTSAGVTQINSKTKDVSSAIGLANNGQTTLIAGLSTMKQSLKTAEDGSSQLASGSSELASGTTKLNNGLSSLSSGADSLQIGLTTAEDGMIQLSDKLSSGAKKADSSVGGNLTNQVSVMSSPILTKDSSYDLVANYGSSLTPYFVSLALWVGGLMTFFVIDFDKKPKNKTTVITKYLALCVVGIAQSIILDSVLIMGLGLKVENLWQFYGFTILVSLSFMSILQLLIHNLGNIGRYIAIILLVLQLTSAAGTFPKETLPLFFQIVNPCLPMTYSISGIRDIVFTHELSNMTLPIVYLLGLIIVSLSINLVLAHKRAGKMSKKVI